MVHQHCVKGLAKVCLWRPLRTVLWVVALLLLSGASRAEQLVDLYRYKTLVASRDQKELNRAINDGFAEVLVRAAGQAQVLQDPNVVRELRRARSLVVQYVYESTSETIAPGDGPPVPATRLVITYSAQEIDKLLRNLQLPFWPPNRPNMLVWIVVDEGASGRRFANEQSFKEVVDAVRIHTERRGIPLSWPLLDLEDQVALSADSAWRLDEGKIKAASERYHPDSILVGRLKQSGSGEWQSDWQLLHKDRDQVMDSRASEVNNVVATVMDRVADYFFSQYGIVRGAAPAEVISLAISGIDRFEQYMAALKYLEGMAIVRRADLIAVNGNRMQVQVYTEGDMKLFQDALALEKKLVPDTAVVSPGIDNFSSLAYVWR